MASEKIAALIEEVKALTVIELSELVHALEDEFGVSAAAMATPAAGAAAAAPAAAPEAAKPAMADAVYAAHMNGEMKLMCEVEDETFAECMLGDGVAIEPSEGKLYSPCNGTIDTVFDTKHAISLVSEEGSEILLHIGIDTVELGGKFFNPVVEADQEVK